MFYATTRKAVPQILSDIGLILWCVLWGFLASKTRALVLLFGVPASNAHDDVQNLAQSLDSAAQSVESTPLIGDLLSSLLRTIEQAVNGLGVSLQQFVRVVDIASIVIATIVFVVPFVYYMWKWAPWRWSFIREATAGKKLLSSEDCAELFALRAIVNAPMRELAKITTDPMGAWKDGDMAVIRKLAALELRRDGLTLPKEILPSAG